MLTEGEQDALRRDVTIGAMLLEVTAADSPQMADAALDITAELAGEVAEATTGENANATDSETLAHLVRAAPVATVSQAYPAYLISIYIVNIFSSRELKFLQCVVDY